MPHETFLTATLKAAMVAPTILQKQIYYSHYNMFFRF